MYEGIDAEVERLNSEFIEKAGAFYTEERSKLYQKLKAMGVKMSFEQKASYDLYPTFIFAMADIYRLSLYVRSIQSKEDTTTIEQIVEAVLGDFIEGMQVNQSEYVKKMHEQTTQGTH